MVFRLSRVGSRGQQPQHRDPDFPLRRHLGQLIWRNHKGFLGQPRNIVPPACPGSSSGPPPCTTCPEHLTREASRRHPNQMPEPPQLALLDVEKQSLYWGTTTLVCQSSVAAPDVHAMLQSCVSQHNPTTSRTLKNSGRFSSTPGALPPRSHPGDLSTRDWIAHPKVPNLHFLSGRCAGGIEDLFKVRTPPTAKFLPSNHPSRMPFGLPVPIRCFWSPTGQNNPIGLLFQPDSIPQCQCPPAGSRIAAATGTNNLTTTAPVSCLGNGGTEHGPLELNVESPPHKRLSHAFPAEPQDAFWSARSDWHPPPPLEPAHHQVVVSGKVRSPLPLSVQDMQPQIR
ncbi:hypothetical protein AMECASPLE_022161 [Ameca splendens]|uniref:Uncharacterized protein n=1 Tax=Ameca splendens TaxID=208324 RepID=A0ABV0ZP41_9TELE